MKKFLFIILLVFQITNFEVFAQISITNIYHTEILKNGDTVFTTRTPGNWWIGGYAEIMYSKFFGDYNFPVIVLSNGQVSKQLLKYQDGSYFPGFSIGIISEYNPHESKWGFGAKIGVFDYFKNKMQQTIGDTNKFEYEVQAKYQYLPISIFAKYKMTNSFKNFWSGFNTFCGINVDIPIGASVVYKKAFYNPLRIEETFNYTLKEQLFRVSMQVGIEKDFFDANVEKGSGRTIFTPYFLLNVGTNPAKDFSSSQIPINLKIGFSLKFGKDIKRSDTSKYTPFEKRELKIPEIEQNSLTFVPSELSEFSDFELVYINPVPEEDTIPQIKEPTIDFNPTIEKYSQKPSLGFDKKYIVNFPRSETDVEIAKSSKDFFGELANFMKKNNGALLIIEGYNDDRGGSIRENQRLSILRAENAKQELVNRGISSGRIVTSGKGAIKNIASNESASGRAKNRRIEIVIKQNKPPNKN